MKPIEFEGQNSVAAKDQPEYSPMPVHIEKGGNGAVTSCWQLTPEEIEIVKETGVIYLEQWCFGRGIPPMIMTVNRNDIDSLPKT